MKYLRRLIKCETKEGLKELMNEVSLDKSFKSDLKFNSILKNKIKVLVTNPILERIKNKSKE